MIFFQFFYDFVFLASLLQSLSKHQEAIIHFREAIRLSPNSIEAYEGNKFIYKNDT